MEQLNSRAFVERVQAYLAGASSLGVLDQWIMERIETFLARRTPWDELALELQVWVAEMNQGHRDEGEVRQLIQAFVDRHAVVVRASEPVAFGSSNVTSSGSVIPAGQAGAVLQSVHR